MLSMKSFKRMSLVIAALSTFLLGGALVNFTDYAEAQRDIGRLDPGNRLRRPIKCETNLNGTILPSAIRFLRREGKTFYFKQDAPLNLNSRIEFSAKCVNSSKQAVSVYVCINRISGDLGLSHTLLNTTIPYKKTVTIERAVIVNVMRDLSRGIHRTSVEYFLVHTRDCGGLKLSTPEEIEIVLEKTIN